MAEGGTLPWKVQKIDESRGPAANYDAVHRSLPDLPDGVAWQKNDNTKEWSLVRVDQDQEKDKYKYALKRATAWNPRTGREQLTATLVPKTARKSKGVEDDNNTIGTEVSLDENGETPPVPVLGKDYLVHTILPSDTFSGLCLRYKIKPVVLRRVNHFSGTNLSLAPSKLIIPLTHTSIDNLRLQDTSSPEYKMQVVLTEFPHLTSIERKAYLEMNDWDVEETLEQIRQDNEWETSEGQNQQHSCAEIIVSVVEDESKARMKPLEVDA